MTIFYYIDEYEAAKLLGVTVDWFIYYHLLDDTKIKTVFIDGVLFSQEDVLKLKQEMEDKTRLIKK